MKTTLLLLTLLTSSLMAADTNTVNKPLTGRERHEQRMKEHDADRLKRQVEMDARRTNQLQRVRGTNVLVKPVK